MLPKRYPLNQSPFYKLRTRKKLAAILGTDTATIKHLAKAGDKLYREFGVAKKTGGKRDVEEPGNKLKVLQGRIATKLSHIQPPEYLFCPVKGRCYVSNAAQHRGNRVVHCLDIRKYFPSTSFERVLWFFRSIMHCSEDVSWSLAKIATYKGHLPTGSPLSPIMAYYAHYDVWESISTICKAHGYTLTVYIDDVTISGQNISAEVIWSIKKTIHRVGLRYHKEKAYVDRPSEITGVIVNGDTMTVPNRQLQKLAIARRALQQVTRPEDRKFYQSKLIGLSSQITQVKNISSRK